MIIMVKTPEQKNFVIRTINDGEKKIFEQMQELVGGYIEQVRLSKTISILCNEDGNSLNLPYNCSICGYGFVGTIIMVGTDGDEFCDVDLDIIGIYKALIQI